MLLDVPVKIGLARANKRSDPDRFEQEQVDFFERVREAYLDMAQAAPDRYRVIDAAQPLETVRQQLRGVLSAILPGPTGS